MYDTTTVAELDQRRAVTTAPSTVAPGRVIRRRLLPGVGAVLVILAGLQTLDDGALDDIVSVFADEVASDLAELERALASRDATAVARVGHELRGSSATIGASRVRATASALEATASAGARELADALRRGVGATTDDLQRRFAGEQPVRAQRR